MRIMVLYKEYWKESKTMRKRRHILPFTHDYQMVGFFDGAAKDETGGCGFILYLNKEHYFRGWMVLDYSTNNFSELMAVWILLHWAHIQDLRDIKIFGDSRIVLGWLQGKTVLQVVSLTHWCSKIRELIKFWGRFILDIFIGNIIWKWINCPRRVLDAR